MSSESREKQRKSEVVQVLESEKNVNRCEVQYVQPKLSKKLREWGGVGLAMNHCTWLQKKANSAEW